MNTEREAGRPRRRIRKPINLTMSDAARAMLVGWRSPSRYIDALILMQDKRWKAQWAALVSAGRTPETIEALIRDADPAADLLVFEYAHGNPRLIALLPPVRFP